MPPESEPIPELPWSRRCLRDPECPMCYQVGVWLSREVRACGRHFTDAEHALVAEYNRRGRAIGIPRWPNGPNSDCRARVASLDWPYGPNICLPTRAAMLDWAENHRLKLRRKGGFRLPEGSSRAWLDHVTYWSGPAGEQLLVSHPYALMPDDAAWLRGLSGFRVEIRDEGWYGAGTTFITVWQEAA